VTGRAATSRTSSSEVVEHSLLDAARVLRESLVRVHPSFRFEERLAARLASGEEASVETATVIPFPIPAALGAVEGLPHAFDVDSADVRTAIALSGERIAWWGQVPRGALIGGAIASGFSIAGAALLARRWLQRPSRVVESGRGAA